MGRLLPHSLPPPPILAGARVGGGGVDFRDGAVFAMQHRFVGVSHVEDDGAERLN